MNRYASSTTVIPDFEQIISQGEFTHSDLYFISKRIWSNNDNLLIALRILLSKGYSWREVRWENLSVLHQSDLENMDNAMLFIAVSKYINLGEFDSQLITDGNLKIKDFQNSCEDGFPSQSVIRKLTPDNLTIIHSAVIVNDIEVMEIFADLIEDNLLDYSYSRISKKIHKYFNLCCRFIDRIKYIVPADHTRLVLSRKGWLWSGMSNKEIKRLWDQIKVLYLIEWLPRDIINLIVQFH